MTRERLNFTFLGHERYYSYEESDPKYEVVKSRLRSGVSARIWFKEPLTFIFPLYSKELWRIDMGEETIVGYDELAASAGWVKIVIALVGSILFGILTIVFALSTLRKSTA